MRKLLLFFSVVTISVLSTFSQEKFEKEYRIKATKVPKKSLKFIKNLDVQKKVRWYAEESQDGKTFEAKVKHNGHKYSIEFSEKGDIIDVEKTIQFSELTNKINRNISEGLAKRFQKFKIKKIQVQFSGHVNQQYSKIFKLVSNHAQVTILYELIVKGKTKKENSRFEILMNAEGEILKELKFKPSNSINLEF